MDSGLAAVDDYDGNEWKLTLKDDSRNNLTASADSVVRTSTKIISVKINYSNAQTGNNEYLSAMVTDSSDVTHYGRVKHLTDSSDASGTAEINRSTVSMNSGDKLCIFNEQYNGDYMTDYASALEEVTIPSTINAYDVSTTLTNLTSNGEVYVKMREGYTATLTADSGYILPETIAVTVGSTPLAQGTDYTYDSTSGVLSIRADVISDPITIEAAGIAKSYSISADTESWDFGTVTEGYTQDPAAKTVTITNTGNQDVTVDLPPARTIPSQQERDLQATKPPFLPAARRNLPSNPKPGLARATIPKRLPFPAATAQAPAWGCVLWWCGSRAAARPAAASPPMPSPCRKQSTAR